jgi:hypothetical protein
MLIHVKTAYVRCPSCNCAVDVHVLFLTSLLGPPAVACHRCGTAVPTDRIEWWQMEWRARCWFFGVSLFYAALALFAGGLSTTTSLRFLETGAWRQDWRMDEPAYWVGGGIWAGLVVLIQLYRVVSSSVRKKKLEEKPMPRPTWSFQVGGQIKFLVLLLLVPAVCWVIGWVARP